MLCKTENQKYVRKGIKIVCPGSAELCYHVEADESFLLSGNDRSYVNKWVGENV